MIDKIKPLAAVEKLAREAGARGRTVVFTNGCFDLLHVGHVRYLEEARRQGDLLIVGLNSDASVRAIKGELRPLVPQEQRAEVLAALEAVSYVVLFDEPDPGRIIEKIRPRVLVKGGDWALENIVGRSTVEADGGRVVRIRLVEGSSTTNLVKKIATLYAGGMSD